MFGVGQPALLDVEVGQVGVSGRRQLVEVLHPGLLGERDQPLPGARHADGQVGAGTDQITAQLQRRAAVRLGDPARVGQALAG